MSQKKRKKRWKDRPAALHTARRWLTDHGGCDVRSRNCCVHLLGLMLIGLILGCCCLGGRRNRWRSESQSLVNILDGDERSKLHEPVERDSFYILLDTNTKRQVLHTPRHQYKEAASTYSETAPSQIVQRAAAILFPMKDNGQYT